MRTGFLVWNQFQVAHAAEIAKHFDEPDFIFIDRTPAALKHFDPAWLVPYGAYTRFVSELGLSSLDGQYDAIVSQFRPPLKSAWSKTKLVMQQYSLAKPKTAYNARWFAADLGLVYGAYSESIIGQMCPVAQAGNPRFDPYFAGGLEPGRIEQVRARLDPEKKTILYLPTWGDLSQASSFGSVLSRLSEQFNIIMRPHHLTPLRDKGAEPFAPGLLDAAAFPGMLDLGLHLMAVADLVISDMSGAIFDAIYCRKPIILIGDERADFSAHKKADDSALEVSQRDRIGPYVTDADDLERAVYDQLVGSAYREENERLVGECFSQRGGCAELAAAAIRHAVENESDRPLLQVYAAPDFSSLLLSRAASAARKRRSKRPKRKGSRSKPRKVGRQLFPSRISRWLGGQVAGKSGKPAKKKQPLSLAALVKQGQFLAAGMKLESWSRQDQRKRAQTVYQAQSATSALRFSRTTWRRQVAKLFDDAYAASTEPGRRLLQQLGMLRSAEAWYRSRDMDIPDELAERIGNLGSLAGVLDLAARNEVTGPEEQSCILPSGEVKALEDASSYHVVELHLLASLARDLKDEGQRPYRQSLLEFSRNLVEQMLGLGVAVYPRLQAGIVGATAVSSDGAAFTWHTRDCGRPGHFHLKIGTLYGHFIIDEKGYSGWGSIAGKSLAELVDGVSQEAADAHWEQLRQDLVLEEKSKYSQAEEALPEDWKDFVFLPMQVSDDAVAQLARIDTLSLLNAVIEWAKSRGEMVVVKRHPMCRDREVERAINEAAEAGYISVSTANIHRIIAASRGVVTVNSGVGAEALLQLKPVITTGLSDYAPATRQAGTLEDLYAAMDNIGVGGIDVSDMRRFLWTYTKKYMVRYDDRGAISNRLRELLALEGECAAAAVRGQGSGVIPEIEGTTSIPFVQGEDALARDADGNLVIQEVALGEQCDQLLSELRDAGVRCWLDSGSLLGLVRYGRLNAWEKDIDLGIWIEDFEKARTVCRAIAEKFSLWYREKWVGDVPYALLLSTHSGQKQAMLPVSVHAFYRIDGMAWLPQPYSLVGGRAKYARYVYREVNGPDRAGFRKKVGFLVRHPVYSVCIAMEKMGATQRIGRALKRIEKAETLKEHILVGLFLKLFQWRIPAHYFEDLSELRNDLPHVLVPSRVEDYLEERYGDWRVPVKSWFYVVDDGCISQTESSRLKQHLRTARQQYNMAVANAPAGGVRGEELQPGGPMDAPTTEVADDGTESRIG